MSYCESHGHTPVRYGVGDGRSEIFGPLSCQECGVQLEGDAPASVDELLKALDQAKALLIERARENAELLAKVERQSFALDRILDKELLQYTRQGIIDGCPDYEVRVVQMAAWHYAKVAEAALAGRPPFDCGNCGACKLMRRKLEAPTHQANENPKTGQENEGGIA